MSGLPKAVEEMIADIIGRYCGVEQAEDIDYGAREIAERMMRLVCPECGAPPRMIDDQPIRDECRHYYKATITRAEFIARQEWR